MFAISVRSLKKLSADDRSHSSVESVSYIRIWTSLRNDDVDDDDLVAVALFDTVAAISAEKAKGMATMVVSRMCTTKKDVEKLDMVLIGAGILL